MNPTSIRCPSCSKSLMLPEALPSGTRVRCTSCGKMFASPMHPAAVRAAAPVAPGGSGGMLRGVVLGALLVIGGGAAYQYRGPIGDFIAELRGATPEKKVAEKDGGGDKDRGVDKQPARQTARFY